MQHELLEERTLPTPDHPANGGQENRWSQTDADFKALYIFAGCEFVVADFLPNYVWFRLTLQH